jgi:mono/diheme cytochrome c family protein
VFLALVLIALIGVVPEAQQSNGDPAAKTLKNPVPANAKSVQAGAQLYQKYCKFCHGDSAQGNGALAPSGSRPRDLTDPAWQKKITDGDMFVAIRDGVPPKFQMKGFRSKMTVPEMWHTVNYIRSLGAKSGTR